MYQSLTPVVIWSILNVKLDHNEELIESNHL